MLREPRRVVLEKERVVAFDSEMDGNPPVCSYPGGFLLGLRKPPEGEGRHGLPSTHYRLSRKRP